MSIRLTGFVKGFAEQATKEISESRNEAVKALLASMESTRVYNENEIAKSQKKRAEVRDRAYSIKEYAQLLGFHNSDTMAYIAQSEERTSQFLEEARKYPDLKRNEQGKQDLRIMFKASSTGDVMSQKYSSIEEMAKQLTKPTLRSAPTVGQTKGAYGLDLTKTLTRKQEEIKATDLYASTDDFSSYPSRSQIASTPLTGTTTPGKLPKLLTTAAARSDVKQGLKNVINSIISTDGRLQFVQDSTSNVKNKNALEAFNQSTALGDEVIPITQFLNALDSEQQAQVKEQIKIQMYKSYIEPKVVNNLLDKRIADQLINTTVFNKDDFGDYDASLDYINISNSPIVNKYDADQEQESKDGSGTETTVEKDKTKDVKKVQEYEFSEGYNQRKEEFKNSSPSKLKDFIEKEGYGYDANPLPPDPGKNFDKQIQTIENIVDFINTYEKPISQNELDTLVDVVILRHNIVDKPADRKKVEQMILESVRPRIKPQTKTKTQTDKVLELAPAPKELELHQTKFSDYKKLYRVKDKFDIDRKKVQELSTEDRNKVFSDLAKANVAYDRTIRALEIKLDKITGFKQKQIADRGALKSQLNILKRQLNDLKRFQIDFLNASKSLKELMK